MAIKIIRKKAAAPAPKPEPVVKAPKRSPGKQGQPLDGMCKAAIKGAPMSIVPWYLMASYLYYVHDVSLLTDALYDQLAKDMLAKWGDIKHQHKHLITPEDLKAGTLYRLKEEDYPNMTKNAAAHLVSSSWGMKIDVKIT